MKTYTPEELKEILEEHLKWLNDNDTGKRADLHDADLNGANLSGADLRRANLSYANLGYANLGYADLSYAYLSRANLSYAYLSRANLSGANLSGANLSGANLSYANLSGADLSDADLSRANLSRANLSGANLSCANLSDANLRYVMGNMQEIKSIHVDTYAVTYTKEVMAIGCEQHSIKDWWGFDDRRILEMDGKRALEWWKKWKPILESIGVFDGVKGENNDENNN